MRKRQIMLLFLGAGLLLSACAQQPVGPSVAVLPARNKPFSVFEQDDAGCKHYADGQVAGRADSANEKALGAGAITTGVGALFGAVIGGGSGAGIGALSGAGLVSVLGASSSEREQHSLQNQYDIAYSQCMYAKGDQVPGTRTQAAPPPPPPPPRQ